MKRTLWTKTLVWLLALSILLPVLPLEFAGVLAADFRAQAEENAAAAQVEKSFMELVNSAAALEAQQEGEWRYAVLSPENYAVVLGHADPSAQTLTVPDRLGGADVIGLAAGALSEHGALESLSLPGNVNAVAAGAVPAGTLLCGYHGTYAHTYALGNGYAFQSRSSYDFAQGVIDYADVRTDAFVRHSAYELSLRKLEASRLREGSVFFLVDPNNAYQISYYRVLAMAEQEDGFVSVSCETPIMDEVMRSFSGHNEVMILDPSTLVLREGVSMPTTRDKGMIDEVELPLNITFPFSKMKITVTGNYTCSFVALDYEGSEDSTKSATMEQTDKIEMTVTVEAKEGLTKDWVFKDDVIDLDSIAAKANALSQQMDEWEVQKYREPLGVGYVFSYAGILTLQAQFGLDFEITGAGTIEWVSETITTYHGDTDGNATKSVVTVNDDITANAQLNGRVGVMAEANLYLFCVCVFQVSGFVGFEAELKYEAMKLDLTDGKLTDMDLAVNMTDCLALEVEFVVEVGIRAGVLKVFDVNLPVSVSVGATIKLVNKKLVDKHFHLMPTVSYAELLTGEITQGAAKDNEHDAKDCPYGKSSLEVRLSTAVGDQRALYMQYDLLDPGFTINEPADPTEAYEDYRLIGWYDSSRLSEANEVTFPFTMQEGENLLYGRVIKKYNIHFIYEDGTAVTEPAYLFPGDKFTLPETERPTVKWQRVQSPYNIKPHSRQLEAENGEYTVPYNETVVYLCAYEAPEIEVTFYESIDGGAMYEVGSVVSKAGQSVEAPETTLSGYYEDAGWQLVNGEEITMPYAIPNLQVDPVEIVHFLGTKPAEDDFTWLSGTYPTPGASTTPNLLYFTYGSGDEQYAVVHGYQQTYEGTDYGPLVHLVVPAAIDGIPVTGIYDSAFAGNATLTTVTLPSTINSIGESAFYNCTGLCKVDMSAVQSGVNIQSSAFYGCTGLVQVSVGDEAELFIRDYAFYHSGIVSLSNIALIGDYAFDNCAQLQRVEISAACRSVPEKAFDNCAQLRDVQIPEGVTSIGHNAFSNCTSLLEVEIPAGVDSFGSDIFSGCTSLKKLVVHGAGANTVFSVSAPALEHVEIGEGFTQIKAGLFNNVRTLKTVVLPDSLESIGEYAFRGTGVAGFGFCSNLKTIGAKAFADNPFLTSVALNCEALGEGAFMNCPSLSSVELTGVSSIASSTFENCYALETVSIPSVTEIGERAFYQSALAEISPMNQVETIGKEAFCNCRSLSTALSLDSIRTVGEYALYNCESLQEISLGENLDTIGKYAFQNCASLEELTIPDNVSSIGSGIIQGCTNLRRLSVGYKTETATVSGCFAIGDENNLETVEFAEGVSVINRELFDDCCVNVETLILPSTLKTIRGGNSDAQAAFLNFGMREVIIRGDIQTVGAYAFCGCPRLETVIIEGDCATIGKYAFVNTSALRTVYTKGVSTLNDDAFLNSGVVSVRLDEGIRVIGGEAFRDCAQLESLRCHPDVQEIGVAALYNCVALKELRVGGSVLDRLFEHPGLGKVNMPSLRMLEIFEGTTVLEDDLFAGGVSELEELSLPDSLVEIGASVFKGLGPNIKALELPASLETVGYQAFQGSHLQEVVFPAKVKTIGGEAFQSCEALRRVTVHGEAVSVYTKAFDSCTALEEVIVRGSLKSIGNWAFGNTAIREFVADGVTSISAEAFANNPHLRAFTLYGTETTTVGNAVLRNCPNLEYLYVDGIETITSNMFNRYGDLPGLRRLVIGEGVKNIGTYAFAARTTVDGVLCYSALESVSLPASLEVVDDYAFWQTGIRELVLTGGNLQTVDRCAFSGCTSLERVVLDGVDLSVGYMAFEKCAALQTVRLGSGVKLIDQYAFFGCDIRELSLSEGLETIKSDAFDANENLKSVVLPNSVTTYSSGIFDYCDALERLYVGGGADMSQSAGTDVFDSVFRGLRHLEIAEGPTELAAGAASQIYYADLETVRFPESMTIIGVNNLVRFVNAKWVKLSSAVTRIDSNDKDSYYVSGSSARALNLVTDTYNEVVAQFAANTGANYLSLDGEVPECTLQFFLSLDGTAGAEPAFTDTAEMMSSLTFPETPAQEGYRFVGWFYDAACTVPVPADACAAADMSLYAGYVPNDVTHFALCLPPLTELAGTQTGTLVPEGFVLYASLEQQSGAQTVLPDSPVLEGFVFDGWYRDTLFYTPFVQSEDHPCMLYGRFTTAGQGALTQENATGVTLTDYVLTEIDSAYVTLPESIGGVNVTAIGAEAFSGLPITDLVIPAHVAKIDPRAFYGAQALSQLCVSAANPCFSAVDGVLYNADQTLLVRYPQGRRAASFTVPQTVVAIADRAFEGCSYLCSVTLPDGLESIGAYSFASTALQQVALPDSVRSLGAGAFYGCQQLTELTAYGLESIGANALPGTIALAVRGPLAGGALRSYVLGSSQVNLVYNIRYLSVMDGETELTAYAVEAGMPLPAQAQGGTAGEGRIVYALYTDAALTQPLDASAVMPDQNLTLYADVRDVFEYETTTLDTGETGLLLTAYNGNGGAVVLPQSVDGTAVIALGGSLLASARNAVDSVTIGSGVISIADTALCGADGAAYTGSVQADAGSYAAQWAAQMGYSCTGSIYTLTFNPLGGARIAAVQAACGALVRLPEPVKTGADFGGWYLDAGCTVAAALDESGLYSIPGSDTTLYALWTQTAESLPYTWEENDGGVTITGYTGTAAQVSLPQSINGLPVTQLAARALMDQTGITALTLPESLTTIGDNAFARMTALQAIVIPDSVTSIGYAAFRGCQSLTQVRVGTGLEALGEQAFHGCTALTAFTAGEGGAFTAENGVLYRGATLVCVPAAMTGALTIPDTVESIAPYALAYSRAEAVSFPASLYHIGDGALYNCDSLTEITFADSDLPAVTIPAFFASGADQLRTVTLGSSVFAVESSAFCNCPVLEQAVIAPEVARIEANAFAGVAENFAITGERGSAAQTYAAEQGFLFHAADGSDVTALQLSADRFEFVLGHQESLSVTALPTLPEGEELRWTSSDESVATMSGSVIRCVGRGTATIMVTALSGASASAEITVRGVPAETVALPQTLYIPLDGQVTFAPVITPEWADTACAWSIDDETIAVIDETGTAIGLTLGTTTLRVSTPSGQEASAALTVFIPTEEIVIPEEQQALTLNVIEHDRLQLGAAVTPEDATFPAIGYASGNTSVVTVSESGVITIVGVGDTTLTLTNDYGASGSVAVTIPVTVEAYDISGEAAPEIPAKEYNKYAGPASFSLVINGRTLRRNTDYTLEYDSSSDLGAYTLSIIGKGLFTGTITTEYEIVEKQATISYAGKTVFEEIYANDITYATVSNMSSSLVKRAFAPASDPTNWSEALPTEYGEYILRLYVEDSYGVKGCELLVNIRLVERFVKSIRFSNDEVHVMAGQSFYMLLYFDVEEGVTLSNPGVSYTVSGTEGLVSVTATTYKGGMVFPRFDVASGAEGVVTVTAVSNDYSEVAATITVHVHADALQFSIPNVKEIEEEAFLGTQANIVRPARDATIGPRAFADSENLWQVVIPYGGVTIAEDVLEGSDAAVLMFASIYDNHYEEAMEMGVPFAVAY